VIIRHQRASSSDKGFRHLARYIRGRSAQPRTTWFLAANLPGVTTTNDLELACRLVEAVNAQNTRAGSNRTYHLVISLHPEDRSLDMKELRHVVENLVDTLGFSEHQYIAARHNDKDHEHVHVAINKIHPETFRIHSPAWDHQKLFAAGRGLEAELELTPLRSMAREREKLPRRAADCEAHQGIDSFARWARKTLASALRATPLRSWDDVHGVCGRFGVVLRLHGNGLVFEDAGRGVRVKGSSLGREFSKPRLCKQLGDFQPASSQHLEAARHTTHRYSPIPPTVPQSLWKDYAQSLDQARMQRQHAWSSYRDSALRLRRASTIQGEVSTPARPPRRPTHLGPRQKAPFTTARVPPSHRISDPQAQARQSTESDSEVPTPWQLAPFRGQPRRARRRPCDSTCASTRAGTKPMGSR